MFYFTLTVVTLAVMLATAIFLDEKHEIRLGRAIVIVIASLIPLVNIIVALVCAIRVLAEVLISNKGAVIYRWKK